MQTGRTNHMEFVLGDTLNRERIQNILAGKSVDRVPIFPFLLGFCARNVGYPISTIYNDAEKSFKAQLRTLEQFNFDWGPIYGYASYGNWEFGGEVEMPNSDYQQAPAHKVFPVKTENDIESLQLPDPIHGGCLPIAYEFSRFQEQYNIPISVMLGGVFTMAGNICAAETLCRWMLKKPDLVHRILKIATEHTVQVLKLWADKFGAKNVIPMIWEPLATNLIISPKQFSQFVMPYLIEASEQIMGIGVKHILYHICGEQNANLPYWQQVPMGDPGLCSIGGEIALEKAISMFGERCIIIGNIDPKILLSSPPEKIYEISVAAIEQGKRSPRGYMFSSGCEVSPNTPGYNIYMMSKARKDVGFFC